MFIYTSVYKKFHISAKFDNRLIFQELISELKEQDMDADIIKQHGSYTVISTPELCFRDFATLLAPGTSLDQFMTSQGYPGAKLAFPWDWFTSMEKVPYCLYNL